MIDERSFGSNECEEKLTYSLDDVNVGVEFHVDKAVQTTGIEKAFELCMPQALPKFFRT